MRALIGTTLMLGIAGCTEPDRRVALTAEILKGSTPPAGASIEVGRLVAAAPGDGFWAISPDEARISITSIGFIQADGGGDNDRSVEGRCVVSYSRSAPSLTKLLDCPFSIHSGTYVGIEIGIKNSFDVLIDDAVNGIYTDPASPTKLSATRPASGPQMVNFSMTMSGGTEFGARAFLHEPIQIDSGAAMPTVSLIADMIHTVFINVAGNSLTFYTDQKPAVEVVPSLNGAGRVEYYTSTGTALNVRMGPPGSTDADVNSVRVFYAEPPQPSYIFSPVVGPSSAQNADAATSPVSGELGFRAGGYAGLDAQEVLCWALPTTFAYTSYEYLRRMQTVATIGASTVLRTQHLNGGQAPAPVSGATYASGCPTFAGGDEVTVFLVAK